MIQKVPNTTRASRFKVPNNERVIISIESERMAGTLAVLSITGGTVRLPKRLPHGTFAEIKMETVSGTISAVIELLAIRGTTQAFRFVQTEPGNKKRLEKALEVLESQGLGDKRADPLQHVIRFARKLLPRK